MLKETSFAVGGGLTVALGVALIVGLLLSGAGAEFFAAWLAAAVAIVLGVFFLAVAQDARRYRREYLEAAEAGRELPPGGPPP